MGWIEVGVCLERWKGKADNKGIRKHVTESKKGIFDREVVEGMYMLIVCLEGY